MREHLAGAADQGEELDVEVGDPVLVRERLEGAGVRAAGVVDEEVDPAERLRGAGDEVLNLLGIGDVGPLRVDDAQLLGRGEDLVLVAGADRDADALADELAGDRGAESLSTRR